MNKYKIKIEVNKYHENSCSKHCEYFDNDGQSAFCCLFNSFLEKNEKTKLYLRCEHCDDFLAAAKKKEILKWN